MIVDGVLWGEFYATRHVGALDFAEIDMAYCEALVAILAGAISRARQEEVLGHLAYRDALTGLVNRRGLDEAAAQAMMRRRREHVVGHRRHGRRQRAQDGQRHRRS